MGCIKGPKWTFEKSEPNHQFPMGKPAGEARFDLTTHY